MVCPGSVLALMVTVLVWLFFLPFELNLTISPLASGDGFFGALRHSPAAVRLIQNEGFAARVGE